MYDLALSRVWHCESLVHALDLASMCVCEVDTKWASFHANYVRVAPCEVVCAHTILRYTSEKSYQFVSYWSSNNTANSICSC